MADNNALPLSYLTVKGVRYAIQDDRVDELIQQIEGLTEIIDDDSVSTETTYSSSKIRELIQSIGNLKILVVNSLPTEDIDEQAIYLVPKTAGSDPSSNVKDEYIYVSGQWEKIGDTEIDLSGYATYTYVDATFPPADTVYTKTQVDGLLANLPDENTTYTGDETTIHIDPITNVISIKSNSQTIETLIKTLSAYTAGSNKVIIDSVNRTIDIDVTKLPQPTEPAQSDWNQTDTTALDYILNKPDIVKPDWNAQAGSNAEILNKPTLATVATSGNYNDLVNKPTASQPIRIISASSLSGGILSTDAAADTIIVLTGTNAQTTYSYVNNRGITKHLTGNVDYDIMFRCCGNDRYQPITLPIPID